MKPNEIKIESDGTASGTTITDSDGVPITNVAALDSHIKANSVSRATLTFHCVPAKFITLCTNIENLAKELHEAGRAAVEAGNTVAAEKFGEQTRKFLEWGEITELARDGRRIQAKYLLARYAITPLPNRK